MIVLQLLNYNVFPVYDTEAFREKSSVATLILNHFTSPALCSRKKNLLAHWVGGWVDP